MGWFNDVADAVSGVANNVANNVSNISETVGNTVAGGVTGIANTVAGGVTDAANATANFAKDATNTFSGAAVSAWAATSEEAADIADAVEKNGITIGSGFIAGANIVKDGLEEAAEQTGKGLVAAGQYITSHLCDIGVGAALSAVFATLAADGEEEASVASIAAIAALQTIDNAALLTAAKGLGSLIAAPVCQIPGVSSAVGSQNNLTAIIAFIIFKICKENPKVVVGSAGQVLAGALIYALTSLICEGEIPGGFEAWRGAQNM